MFIPQLIIFKIFVMYQYQVSFSQAVRMAFDSYCRFQGRSSRSEYWWWVLFVAILSFCIGIIEGILGFSMTAVRTTSGILSLVLLLPGLGLSVRRLHDIGKSGWWILLGFYSCGGRHYTHNLVRPQQRDDGKPLWARAQYGEMTLMFPATRSGNGSRKNARADA